MIDFKVSLNLAFVIYLAVADNVPLQATPPIHGVPRPMPRPSFVRPLAAPTTETPIVDEIQQSTLAPKPVITRGPDYSRPSGIYPSQRVNLRPNYLPPGARPYAKPISVSTTLPPTEAPVEQFVAPLNDELSEPEVTQVISSTTAPKEAEVVITEITETEAPMVTEPNPTTVLESQTIIIKPRPMESGLEWGKSQPTWEDLVATPVPTIAPTPIPIYPIKAPPKARPSYSTKSKRVRGKQILKPLRGLKPKPRPPTVTGTSCAAENGYFPIGQDCDAYIECKKNSPTEFVCPDGLHFNPEAVWPNYPCGYPSEVKCAGRTLEREPHPTEECPRQYGFFPMDSADCSRYIMCQEGKATVMSCPPGLAFSVAVDSCDWPENVPACNPAVFQGFQCPDPGLDEGGKLSDLITHFKYGDNCKSYVACQRGRPRLLSCDEGTSFDNETGLCIDSDYVKNCEL